MELYSETVKLRNPWLRFLVLLPGFGFLSLFLLGWLVGGWIAQQKMIWLASSGVGFGLGFFFLAIQLRIQISSFGLDYRLFPIMPKQQHIPFSDMVALRIGRYRPLLEFGGWGLRYPLHGRSKAISVYGNTGLRLKLRNGKEVLIGTSNSEFLAELIRAQIPGLPDF